MCKQYLRDFEMYKIVNMAPVLPDTPQYTCSLSSRASILVRSDLEYFTSTLGTVVLSALHNPRKAFKFITEWDFYPL